MKNQQPLVEAIQNWTPIHTLKQGYGFPLLYFPASLIEYDGITKLLESYSKLKFIAWGNIDNIAQSANDRKLMTKQHQNSSAERLKKRILHDSMIALTSLNSLRGELDTRNPYNILAHFIWNEDVYRDLSQDQAKRLLETLDYWITWVNHHTLPFRERFQEVINASWN
jgi:hypothetical protein